MPCLCSTGIITAEEYKVILKWAVEHELVPELGCLVSRDDIEMVEEIQSLIPRYRYLTVNNFWPAVVRVMDCTYSINMCMYDTFFAFSEREIELLAMLHDPIQAIDKCDDIHELSFLAHVLDAGTADKYREIYSGMIAVSTRALEIFDKYKV